MPSVPVGEVELYYESSGVGEPLLLVAGFACDHTYWSLVVPLLASHFRVIAFDARGMGQSANADASLSIEQMAADAAGLLDALNIESTHIAGHSMGGMVAQELALAWPNRVRSLTLISSCARLDARGQAIIETWGDLPRLTDPRTMARLIVPWMYTDSLFRTPGAIDRLIDEMLAVTHPPTIEGIYLQSRTIGQADTSSRLGQIRRPTLVLTGREDILLPPPFAEQLYRCIAGSRLIELPDAAHGMLIESPSAVADAMLAFVDEQTAPRGAISPTLSFS